MMIDVGHAIKIADEAWVKVEYDRRSIPPVLKVVHLIGWMDYEVNLGGVLGWLVNMGEHGPDTVSAFEAVGAHQSAAVVREILAFFPAGTPATEKRERVQQIMDVESIAEPHWSVLGDRLLAWPDDINALLQKFVTEHEADFA